MYFKLIILLISFFLIANPILGTPTSEEETEEELVQREMSEFRQQEEEVCVLYFLR